MSFAYLALRLQNARGDLEFANHILGLCGFLLVYAGLCGFMLVYAGFCGFKYFCVGLCGFIFVYVGLCGLVWVYVGLWTHTRKGKLTSYEEIALTHIRKVKQHHKRI